MSNKRLTEISALINLLEDSDNKISGPVIDRLISLGEEVIDPLEKHWERHLDQPIQKRIEEVIAQIQHNSVRQELKQWIADRGNNLLYGAFLLARIQYPDLSYEPIKEKIESLRTQVWLELNDHLTALERIRIINYFMFEVQNFDKTSFVNHAPQLYFINHVADTHKGSADLLAIIYQSIANMLDLPVFSVDLPMSSLLCYHDPGYMDDPNGVMFYIHPYGKGTIHSRVEIEMQLIQSNIELIESYFTPCSNITTIRRIAEKLANAYDTARIEEKASYTSQLAALLREAEPGSMF